jgi:TonB family protein
MRGIRTWPLPVVMAALAALLVPVDAGGQTLRGVVRDSAGARIAHAQVSADGRAPTITGTDGSFRIDNLDGAETLLQVRRIGFHPATRRVSLAGDGSTEVTVILATLAQELSPVVVSARVEPVVQRLAGFFERKGRGQGYYVTREQIERTGNSQLTDVLRTFVPSARVQPTRGVQRNTIRLRGANCPPLVWIDGVAYVAGEFDVDNIAPWTVSGVEVYSGPASVPLEFRSVRGLDRCGVIVIWSRNDVVDGVARRRNPRRATAAEPGRIFYADEVDRPARLDSSKTFRPFYPDSLYAFRIPGDVVVEIVIDSTGTPAMDTFAALTSSHPDFTESVRRAISRATFFPAAIRGRPVRQLMVLPFHFKVDG